MIQMSIPDSENVLTPPRRGDHHHWRVFNLHDVEVGPRSCGGELHFFIEIEYRTEKNLSRSASCIFRARGALRVRPGGAVFVFVN